jgi:alkylation response protein AidB-like acyl-CoA dehydrogenase
MNLGWEFDEPRSGNSMNFDFNEEQRLLRKTARDFLAEQAPMARVRELLDDELGYAPELWRRIAELGWTGLMFPEAVGGAGLGYVDLLPVLEELGRALTPVPLLPTLIAGCAILEAGDEAQRSDPLRRICTGCAVATLALAEEDGSSEPEALRLEAREVAGGFELTGTKCFVPDAHAADLLVVAARAAGGEPGLRLVLVPRDAEGLCVTPMRTIDPLRRLFEVRFDGVRVAGDALLGGGRDAGPALRKSLDRALVMICAEMLGGAEKCLDDAVAYARQRVQFGRPIGANQIIQHRCADMLFAIESARALVHYAAWAAAEDGDDAPLTAAMAKAQAGDAYRLASAQNVQIHGGLGFSWEIDCHLHYKRARSDEMWLGDASTQRERVARMLDL